MDAEQSMPTTSEPIHGTESRIRNYRINSYICRAGSLLFGGATIADIWMLKNSNTATEAAIFIGATLVSGSFTAFYHESANFNTEIASRLETQRIISQ